MRLFPGLVTSDLILLHAPSVYDFRKLSHFLGPISDVIPSTPVFEMYPVGFSSIAEYLNKHGIAVRIINLAFRMLDDRDFDVEDMIKKLSPRAFGIDLHWLPHAQGSLEVASMCKKYHPETPVIFGGLSATYFHEELIRYPEVDFVVRGDSTEEPVLRLMQQIMGLGNFEDIPNLTWKTGSGTIKVNDHSYLPAELNGYSNNYKNLFKMAVRYLDVKSLTAIHDWWQYPITAVMTCRGCTQNCAICGGSNYALRKYAVRQRPAYRAAHLVVRDIRQIQRFSNAPIFVVGDLLQPGEDYAREVFRGLKDLKIKNQLVLELFQPAPEAFFDEVAEVLPNFNFQISPESHDETIRAAAGKFYKNADLENNFRWALERGCQRFDVFFMIGLPHQTYHSVMETIDYCETLFQKFANRLTPFISPLAPFVDPGSLVYENPDRYGYRIFYKTLEEHRQALLEPSWKYVLNYETQWMDREEIVQCTYEAGRRLNELKLQYGLINKQTYQEISRKIALALEIHNEMEQFYGSTDTEARRQARQKSRLKMNPMSMTTLYEKDELRWPTLKKGLKFLSIAKAILME